MDIKIIYFDLPFWRAEISRLPLFIANIKFDDVRPSDDDWDYAKENGKMKDGTIIPFRELPVLLINGQSIAQTMAIARICGKLGGMYPEDIIEAGKVDQIVVAVENINALLSPSMKESDPTKKKAMRKELTSNELPTYFGYLQDILSANSSDWFVGENMTIADLAVWSLLGWIASGVIDDISAEVIQPFEGLVKLYNQINKNPRVKEWKIQTYYYDKDQSDEYADDIPDSI
ncbi:MAG: glutathione S-transferase [Gammaproteobacteria bacterium]|nr:glutathione S-transferase [Gammaproteobacteria bacterium]MBT5407311.1 glutathione S-transferase [Gammaproteobacteria bacterium]MBT6634865.1 glutathione S-transferase [Gammaproteobacteria bacterium]MBT7390227.1 glutathione S-transferase [Gammaproteobacteria bacterium]